MPEIDLASVWYLQAGDLAAGGNFECHRQATGVLLAFRDPNGELVKLIVTVQHLLRSGPDQSGDYYPETRAWRGTKGFNPGNGLQVTRHETLTPAAGKPFVQAEDFAFLKLPKEYPGLPPATPLSDDSVKQNLAGLEIIGFANGEETIREADDIVCPDRYRDCHCDSRSIDRTEWRLTPGAVPPVEGVSGGGAFLGGCYAGIYLGEYGATKQHLMLPISRLREWVGYKHFKILTPPSQDLELGGLEEELLTRLTNLLAKGRLRRGDCRTAYAQALPNASDEITEDCEADDEGLKANAPWLRACVRALARRPSTPTTCRLLLFVELLRRHFPLRSPLLARLESCEREIAAALNVDLAQVRAAAPVPTAAPAASAGPPVVQIQITTGDNKWWFVESVLRDGSTTKPLQNTEIAPEAPAPPGTTDPRESDQRARVLGEIVQKAGTLCRGRLPRYEFFLPPTLLLARPERWTVLAQGPRPFILALRYPMVLRALNRDVYDYAEHYWREKWKAATRSVTGGEWLLLHDAKEFDDGLDAVAILKHGCFFSPKCATPEAFYSNPENLFGTLFECGVPFIAWHQDADAAFATSTWWPILQQHPPHEWPNRIMEVRQQLAAVLALSPDRDISILVDDIERPFPTPEMLGANFRTP